MKKMADDLMITLDIDTEQVKKEGFSSYSQHKKLAAIIETMYCELYSILDCTTRVLNLVYGKYDGMKGRKTSKYFKHASEEITDERVPFKIRKALKEAYKDWFLELRKIRTAITHKGIGDCSKGKAGKIEYFHTNIAQMPTNTLVTNDVFRDLTTYEKQIILFVNTIFHELNKTLEDNQTVQFCGIFGGLLYQRLVSPYEATDFNSGVCNSYDWFEREDRQTCPFAKSCGAYLKVKNGKRT
ncbi:hypothetical protein [Methanohalophilus mahii]|nr:hypothetical protein [Methanohalophilus mahii]